jgi:diguanylate cyclase (GGDEF) domain/hemerythrin-like metal-binding domain
VELHIPTIFVMLIAGCVALAVSALATSEKDSGDGLREWGLALCVHATSYILFALREVIPSFLSVVCANSLFSISYSIFLYAIHIFLGIRPRHRWLFGVPPLILTLEVIIFRDNIPMRVVLVNSMLLFQAYFVQHVLLAHKFDFPVRGRNLMVFGIALSLIALAWKFYAGLAMPEQVMSIFLTTPVQLTLYLVTFISLIMVSNGFALMAKERSDASLRKAALLDKLTSCWNRVRIEEILTQEISRMHRYGTPASMLMLDLDKFKQVNDQFGHLAGDEVLSVFGRLLHADIRATDVPGRWGGEEFIVVLPSSTFFDAVTLAEHIRERLTALSFSFGAVVTVSIGVAACRPTDTVEEWIKRADLALYRAKVNGRNQVMVEDLSGSIDNYMCSASRTLHLQWNKTYECGHAEIDNQHKNLFMMANKLLQLNDEKANKENIAAEIRTMIEATIAHFRYEERILKQVAHQGLSPHTHSHQRLLEKTNNLLDRLQSGSAEIGTLLHFMIYELTAQHIMIDDRYFGKISTIEPEPAPKTDRASV